VGVTVTRFFVNWIKEKIMSHILRSYLILFLLAATSIAGNFVYAAELEPAFSVTGVVTVGDNKLGVKPGEQIFTDFMLDPSLTPTLSISTQTNLVFIDPWRWHWRAWDWLRGFIILIPRLPIPGPDPVIIQIQAVFDDSQDMIMDMPGIPPLARGSAFITELAYPADSAFLKEGRLPNLKEISNGFLRGTFQVKDPNGGMLLSGKVDSLKATPSEPACKGDLDGDGDVDATDVRGLRLDFGRTNCPLM
jgi:hypothetical protein